MLQKVLQNLKNVARSIATFQKYYNAYYKISKYCNKYCNISKVLQYFAILLETPLRRILLMRISKEHMRTLYSRETSSNRCVRFIFFFRKKKRLKYRYRVVWLRSNCHTFSSFIIDCMFIVILLLFFLWIVILVLIVNPLSFEDKRNTE